MASSGMAAHHHEQLIMAADAIAKVFVTQRCRAETLKEQVCGCTSGDLRYVRPQTRRCPIAMQHNAHERQNNRSCDALVQAHTPGARQVHADTQPVLRAVRALLPYQ